jgi:hypothetical protein
MQRKENKVPSIDLILDGEGAWPDLVTLKRRGKLIEPNENATIGLSALTHGMASGRASVALRIDLPDGRVVFAQTSLRVLWNAVKALADKYGEPWMKEGVPDDLATKAALASREILTQLADAKQRLGEPVTLNFTESDRVYAELVQLRAENAALHARLAAS